MHGNVLGGFEQVRKIFQSDCLSFSLSSLLSRVSDSRVSVLSRSEEDNRISKKNRKEWSMSKSQVLLERPADRDEVCWFLLFMAGSERFNPCVSIKKVTHGSIEDKNVRVQKLS